MVRNVNPKIVEYERNKVYNAEPMRNIVINLYYRWQDEKEYEDFKDYEILMRKTFSSLNLNNVTFVKSIERPFGFIYNAAQTDWQISYNSRGEYKVT